jgi:hypothetical protein
MSPMPRHVGHRTSAVGNGSDSWPPVILAGVPPRREARVIQHHRACRRNVQSVHHSRHWSRNRGVGPGKHRGTGRRAPVEIPRLR